MFNDKCFCTQRKKLMENFEVTSVSIYLLVHPHISSPKLVADFDKVKECRISSKILCSTVDWYFQKQTS